MIFDGFEFNERVKETLVKDYQAKLAITKTFLSGVPIIPEPFLETAILWDSSVSHSILAKALQFILLSKIDIDKIADMTTPQLEIINDTPQIVWAIFNQE